MIRILGLTTALIALPFIAFAKSGGNEVGNGGDLIECRRSTENAYQGLYSLDYLLTDSPSKSAIEIKTWEESLFKIRQVLAMRLPELLPSFDQFANQVFSSDMQGTMVWERVALSLIDIKDEDLPTAVQIPSNCRTTDRVQLIQAIVRQKSAFSGTSQIVFKYNEDTINKIKDHRPLQLSYLLIHEWLWSLSDNVERNRRLNHFIHQPDFYRLARIELLSIFKQLGLNIPEVPVVVASDGTGHYTNLDSALQAQPQASVFQLKPGRYRVSNLVITRPVQFIGLEGAEKTYIEAPSNTPAILLSTTSGTSTITGLTFVRTSSNTSNDLDAYYNAALVSEAGSVRIEKCRFGALRPLGSSVYLVPELSGLFVQDSHLELVGNQIGYGRSSSIYIGPNVSGYSDQSTFVAGPDPAPATFSIDNASAMTFHIRDHVKCNPVRFADAIMCRAQAH